MATVNVQVTVREGYEVIASGLSGVDKVRSIMLDAMSTKQVMVEWASLRKGNDFTFTHKGKTITVNPLVRHYGQY